MTKAELNQIAKDLLWQIQYGPKASRLDHIFAALQRVQRLMQVERDHARANASILAHAYEHDSRPPWIVVRESLAYPLHPAHPDVEEDTHDRG